MINTRFTAVTILHQVITKNRHLNDAFNETFKNPLEERERSFITELCYGICRWYFRLNFYVNELLAKPLKKKDYDLHCLLLLGIYQLTDLRIPEHAAVNETVDVTQALKKPWAKAMVNGVLRNFLRKRDELIKSAEQNEEAFYSHPSWFIRDIRHAWPLQWKAILNLNNEKASLILRINSTKISRDEYLQQLNEKNITAISHPLVVSGIILKDTIPVSQLPGFESGRVTVQDASAQLAAFLLEPKIGERVLDACAAPGGKTTHLLEVQGKLKELVSIDKGLSRIHKLKETCARFGATPTIIDADASEIHTWWDGAHFDRILLDAPCSATGIIRRHPDIKIHRAENEIDHFVQEQSKLLKAVWTILKPGGTLLYATCSILPEENHILITQFLKNHSDAKEYVITENWGICMNVGRQLLPSGDNDGFYYARLVKSPN